MQDTDGGRSVTYCGRKTTGRRS